MPKARRLAVHPLKRPNKFAQKNLWHSTGPHIAGPFAFTSRCSRGAIWDKLADTGARSDAKRAAN